MIFMIWKKKKEIIFDFFKSPVEIYGNEKLKALN